MAGRRAGGRSPRPRHPRRSRDDRHCALREEPDGVSGGQRLDGVLALAGDAQRRPAPHQQLQVRAGAEQRGEPGRRVEHLLEVVEHGEHLLCADVGGKRAVGADRLCDRRRHQLRVGDGRERDPVEAVGEVVDGFGGELGGRAASLPEPPGPVSVSSCVCRRILPASSSSRWTADERGQLHGERRGMEHLQLAGKSSAVELEEPDRCRPRSSRRCSPRSRSSHPAAHREREPGPLRDEHLPAVGLRPSMPTRRTSMTDCSLLRSSRPGSPVRSPDAHANRPVGERLLRVARRRDAAVGGGKAAKIASPCVSTSTPPCRATASRSSRRCSESASA